jgi:hypothetical protein
MRVIDDDDRLIGRSETLHASGGGAHPRYRGKRIVKRYIARQQNAQHAEQVQRVERTEEFRLDIAPAPTAS